MDWSQQSDEYDKKVKTYEREKMEYDAFCEKKLGEIQKPTSKEKEELEELRKRKASEEKFLAFSSKKYPNHPTYAEQKQKKHMHTVQQSRTEEQQQGKHRK
jgi:hypothetical protein